MKRLGMLLVLVSVSMFALGCSPADKKEDPNKKDPNASAPKDVNEDGKEKAPGGETDPAGTPAPTDEKPAE